jgi:CENP-Q, a CENPA-CAD centromere complex subunit
MREKSERSHNPQEMEEAPNQHPGEGRWATQDRWAAGPYTWHQWQEECWDAVRRQWAGRGVRNAKFSCSTQRLQLSNMHITRLIQRLPRMPFPQGTDELSFDFEFTINRQVGSTLACNSELLWPAQRVLDEQLTANTHTLGLLGAELEAETRSLQQEKAQLESLERELADLEASHENESSKRQLHPLAQSDGREHDRTFLADYEARLTAKKPTATLSDLEPDPGAREVIDQLRHHLDSMQKNVESTKDVAAAISTSQAALDVFNWRHLKEVEYHQVYGVNATWMNPKEIAAK